MTEEHPFAQFVRIIGRGPNLSRALTEDEMIEATRMIMRGEVEPLQLGAFLCVLRVRTEDPGEGAGFIRAVREEVAPPSDSPAVDLDWSSYAGKKRHLPWFLLSALLLAQNGIKVFMHGTEGHTPGRIYAREALESLGVAPAASMADAADRLRRGNFAFLPLQAFAPRLQEIMDLKPILGLRSPINTFARMINPFRAPYSIQSIFHPNYREIHRDTESLLGQPHMCVFKGEGGEAERRPGKPVVVESLHEGEYVDEEWPALMAEGTFREDEDMDVGRLARAWRGEENEPYPVNAVVGTAAIALRLMGRAATVAETEALARDMWEARDRGWLEQAA
jgi:anthranilate phosphoribosyltransferase